jgi:hypothetical protein
MTGSLDQRHNPVLQARHAHLTSPTTSPPAQAGTALAAAPLSWLWMVVTNRIGRQAAIAAGIDAQSW